MQLVSFNVFSFKRLTQNLFHKATYLNSSIDKKLRPTNPFRESASAAFDAALLPNRIGDAFLAIELSANIIELLDDLLLNLSAAFCNCMLSSKLPLPTSSDVRIAFFSSLQYGVDTN